MEVVESYIPRPPVVRAVQVLIADLPEVAKHIRAAGWTVGVYDGTDGRKITFELHSGKEEREKLETFEEDYIILGTPLKVMASHQFHHTYILERKILNGDA